jgi:hypothetical protein
MKREYLVAALICAAVVPMLVSASVDFTSLPCTIIKQVRNTINVVGPTLVLIMFLYGGIKYTMSADNPGGRNQGKTICIHAIIAGLIFVIWKTVESLLNGSGGGTGFITWWKVCW